MATIQGLCKNCGALIMFDDRDDKCECVFCNCVFSSAEAIEIMNNREDYTFENKEYEPSEDNRHHYSTRVYSDEGLEKAIKREELAKANKSNGTVERNEFEISPSDVKAPKKFVIGLIASIVVVVAAIVFIAFPLHTARNNAYNNITSNINKVFADTVNVNTELDEGKTNGYIVFGQTCQNIKFVTDDSVDSATAVLVYRNYCAVRAEALGKSESMDKSVTMLIYASNGIFEVTYDGSEVLVSEQ